MSPYRYRGGRGCCRRNCHCEASSSTKPASRFSRSWAQYERCSRRFSRRRCRAHSQRHPLAPSGADQLGDICLHWPLHDLAQRRVPLSTSPRTSLSFRRERVFPSLTRSSRARPHRRPALPRARRRATRPARPTARRQRRRDHDRPQARRGELVDAHPQPTVCSGRRQGPLDRLTVLK